MADSDLYSLPSCKGSLRWSEASIPVTFDLRCSCIGELAISIVPLPLTDQTIALVHLHHERGRSVRHIDLNGVGPNDERLSTASAHLANCRIRSDHAGSSVHADLSASNVTVTLRNGSPEPSAALTFRYFVSGLRAAGVLAVTAPCGRVEIHAPWAFNEDEQGIATIDVAPATAPVEVIDEQVDRILDILSLADGHRIRWVARETFRNESLASVYFAKSHRADAPRFPLLSHLNLQPCIELAVARYNQDLIDRTGVQTAIGWLLLQTRFQEVELVLGMTALEHMIHVFGTNHLAGPIIAQAVFRQHLLPKLDGALRASLSGISDANASNTAYSILHARLLNLNQRTLRDGLTAFLGAYRVPVSDVESLIPALLRYRNAIIHTGRQPTDEDLPPIGELGAVLRELLTRIILTLLEYEGHYWSYLNGPEWSVIGTRTGS